MILAILSLILKSFLVAYQVVSLDLIVLTGFYVLLGVGFHYQVRLLLDVVYFTLSFVLMATIGYWSLMLFVVVFLVVLVGIYIKYGLEFLLTSKNA